MKRVSTINLILFIFYLFYTIFYISLLDDIDGAKYGQAYAMLQSLHFILQGGVIGYNPQGAVWNQLRSFSLTKEETNANWSNE